MSYREMARTHVHGPLAFCGVETILGRQLAQVYGYQSACIFSIDSSGPTWCRINTQIFLAGVILDPQVSPLEDFSVAQATYTASIFPGGLF